MSIGNDTSPEALTKFGAASLPGFLGIEIVGIRDGEVTARLEVKPHHLAPNGFLHAGTVVTLADTAAGYACIASLPEGANSFTTIEIKSNHLGRTTQVWDVVVTNEANGKTIALFRCTQMILYSK